MKLLFDENLSPQLVGLLHDLFPDSVHVRDVGLKAADDPVVWKYAQNNALIICSKDSDMHQAASVPPLRRGAILDGGRKLLMKPMSRAALVSLAILIASIAGLAQSKENRE